MQFEKTTKRRIIRNKYVATETSYPCSLQMYKLPPSNTISLKDFDEYALERLKVLKSIERLNLTSQVKNSDEWSEKLYQDFKTNKYFVPATENISVNKLNETEQARHKDLVSHFILRLGYCRTEELRRWFINQETELFRARFIHCSRRNHEEIRTFMKHNNINYHSISEEEKMAESENLIKSSLGIPSVEQMSGINFFKVPFTEALELVRHRKCFLKNGFAYVPETDVMSLISSTFRAHLSKALTLTGKYFHHLEDDERIMKHINDLDKRYTGMNTDYKTDSATKITAAMIDQLSMKSFPLCMRQLNDTLKSTHHLKHSGRLQYGLFLKGAGLKLEEALQFWRSHFLKNMDVDKFDKQYSYSIRHSYGQEGKRANYSPYSCIKIITTSVGPGDNHGCPFKHTDAAQLKQRLLNFKVSSSAITEIMDLTTRGHYQIACEKYWEATHNHPMEAAINHPNQYFALSQQTIHGVPMNNSQGGVQAPKIKPKLNVQRATIASSQDDTPKDTEIFDDDIDFSLLEEY